MPLGEVNLESIMPLSSVLREEGTEYAPGPGTFCTYLRLKSGNFELREVPALVSVLGML